MFQLGRASRNHRPHAAIVCVDQILQNCHLLPKFGSGSVPTSWFRGNALDTATDFYLNRYIDFYLFEDICRQWNAT
jgi:hypothetical protein